MIQIDDEKTVLLTLQNVDNDIVKKLNSTIETDLKNFESEIKTNVAIASAVTANARIHMIDFKMSDNTCYTDTDSIFTTEPLPKHLVSDELGLMKDEMKGIIIQEAYFLDIKKYGYWYFDKDGNRIEKSTIAGVERNTVSFKDIE